MLQVLEDDDFARKNIAPQDGIKKGSFAEAVDTRGLEQLQILFEKLTRKVSGFLPNSHPELGELVALDGSLIDATLSMSWQDDRKCSKKAEISLGFDLNHCQGKRCRCRQHSFFDADVLPGTEQNNNQLQKPVRLAGYHVNGFNYRIATD